MPSRTKPVPKKKAAKPAARKPATGQKNALHAASAKKPVASMAAATSTALRPPVAPLAAKPPARPAHVASVGSGASLTAAKPAARPMSAGQVATAQQAEERRKAATRKLFARIRSLEAILGADLRKRGSLLLSQAVDQWYAEATSATATDVSITNAARAVISQL
jgi:hypothetical protein